jgi:hypothetical protein
MGKLCMQRLRCFIVRSALCLLVFDMAMYHHLQVTSGITKKLDLKSFPKAFTKKKIKCDETNYFKHLIN